LARRSCQLVRSNILKARNTIRSFGLVLAVAFVVAACASAQGNPSTARTGLTATQRAAIRWSNQQLQSYTELVWRYDDVLGKPHMHFSYRPGSSTSLAYIRQFVLKKRMEVAHKLHLQVKRLMVKQTKVHLAHISQLQFELGKPQATRGLAEAETVEEAHNLASRLDKKLTQEWHESPLYNGFMCIHHYEGAWNASTGNGYYGGLQMDRRFQSLYGSDFVERWGTADNWPTWAQLLVSVRAYRSGRGFYPWPNTARACGLI
jgi:hypothetical protein